MKNQFTFLKISLVGLFLMIGGIASAQTFDYYACAGSTINLTGNLKGDETPYDEYLWVVNDGTTDIHTQTVFEETYPYTVPTQPGAYTIRLQVRDENGCFSVAQLTTLYVLPGFSVAISASSTEYCVDATGSILTATATPTEALPAGVSFQYDWDETNQDGSTIINANIAPDTNPYTVDKTTDGDYYFVAKAKYVVSSGQLVSIDGCLTPSEPTNIKVNPLPSTPTITITAN